MLLPTLHPRPSRGFRQGQASLGCSRRDLCHSSITLTTGEQLCVCLGDCLIHMCFSHVMKYAKRAGAMSVFGPSLHPSEALGCGRWLVSTGETWERMSSRMNDITLYPLYPGLSSAQHLSLFCHLPPPEWELQEGGALCLSSCLYSHVPESCLVQDGRWTKI